MTDLFSVTRYEQREIERQLALAAVTSPLYTMQEAGWLPANIFLTSSIRRFWEILQGNICGTTTGEQAENVVTEAIVISGIGKEVDLYSLQVVEPMPRPLAQEVARRHYISAVASRMGNLLNAIQNSDDETIRHIILEIAQATPVGSNSAPNAEEINASFEEVVSSGNCSVKTMIPGIDRALHGLDRKTETIVMARPSMGKTGIIWQMARNISVAGYKVMFYSLEMSSVMLWARAACPAAGISWQDVKSATLTDAQKDILFAKGRELAALYGDRLRVDDNPGHTTDTIWQDCAAWRPDVVFVDHLRLVKDKIGDNENKRQGYVAQRLKEMAKSLNCSVVIAAQLNRGVEDRNDKRPMLSDLRDCGEIEEVADVVLGMYRDDYYHPPIIATHRHLTEVWLRKNRDGVQNGVVKLVYDTVAQWFEEPEGKMEPRVFRGQE